MIYLDSSAVVKLAHPEAESDALRDWLDERTDLGWISSSLLEVEAFRALMRFAPTAIANLHPVLDLVSYVEQGPAVRILARTIKPATVRSLDAIHLGTALLVRSEIDFFVTYDKRLAEAAGIAGFTTQMPT